ncbi:MAG TPA: SGNH/GDSL hydrolase family protein [Gemmatimonadales bacterium]|nr:SGNH/GDSL hydrolase family protein [Gemmatimonadales bacterium]
MRLLTVLLLTTLASCGSTAGEPADDPDLRILFIGNSLTQANQLPDLVQHLGRSDPSRNVRVGVVANGGYSLEDHWNRGEAQRAIASQRWDLVVLQQGPSALPESRELLIDYATRFAAEIRKVGARPAIYMVWPELERESEWDNVTASHVAAAQAIGGLLLPGGEALRALRASHPSLQLFSDGFHPTLAGSYEVALIIYGEATGVSPIGLTLKAGGIGLPTADVSALEAAAADVIEQYAGE